MKIEVRVAGLVKKGGKILLALHRKSGEEYWVVPGGRVRSGESLKEALRRELKEETGLSAKVGRLVMVHDFIRKDSPRQVLNIYFSAALGKGSLRALGKGSLRRTFRGRGFLRGVNFFSEREVRRLSIRPAIKKEITRYLRGGLKERTYLGRK